MVNTVVLLPLVAVEVSGGGVLDARKRVYSAQRPSMTADSPRRLSTSFMFTPSSSLLRGPGVPDLFAGESERIKPATPLWVGVKLCTRNEKGYDLMSVNFLSTLHSSLQVSRIMPPWISASICSRSMTLTIMP